MARTRVVEKSGWQRHLDVDDLLENKIGRPIADDARRMCPVDTGALRDTIEHNVDASRIGPILGKVRISAGGHGVDYPVYVEMGTSTQSPQPFLRPAALKRRVV